MPVYFGFPISCDEALRIFNIDKEVLVTKIINSKNWTRENVSDCHLICEINEYFENKLVKIKIYPTIKSHFILGYEVNKPSDVWTNIDEFLILLINLKIQFATDMLELDGDLCEVRIEYTDNNKLVKHPIPYIISY